jgi:hypothetical protein
MELEIVSEFIYMGTMFQRTGSFKKNKINPAEKASKAMYDILNKGRVHNLSVSMLDLFDKIIIPMLTYLSSVSHNIRKNNSTLSAILQQTLPKVQYRRHKEW